MQQAEGLPLLEVHTFGGLRLRLGGETIGGFASRKVEALVVYLAMNRRPQPREALADLLWDNRSQAQALSNLRTVLASLGKRLNPLLNITRYEVALHSQAPIWLDAAEFETRLAVLGRQ